MIWGDSQQQLLDFPFFEVERHGWIYRRLELSLVPVILTIENGEALQEALYSFLRELLALHQNQAQHLAWFCLILKKKSSLSLLKGCEMLAGLKDASLNFVFLGSLNIKEYPFEYNFSWNDQVTVLSWLIEEKPTLNVPLFVLWNSKWHFSYYEIWLCCRVSFKVGGFVKMIFERLRTYLNFENLQHEQFSRRNFCFQVINRKFLKVLANSSIFLVTIIKTQFS